MSIPIVLDNIVFDLQKFGGISVVWQELIHFLSQKGEAELRYIDVDIRNSHNYSRGKLEIPSSDVLATVRWPQIERYLPVKVLGLHPFIFHSSYYRYCVNPHAVNVTTVHDFTYEYYVRGIKQKVHSWQKFAAIRHSDAIVCISENTKRDMLRLMPDIDESKVHVIYNGVSEAFHVLREETKPPQLPFDAKHYVVFIGRRDSYKNFDLTVRSLSDSDLNLLIVGSQLNAQEKQMVERYLPCQRYKCLSHVSDEQLNMYYNYAAALVYLSSYEGFGLPVLEAQRAGCPVIALNASSVPEVIGNTQLMVEKCDEREVRDKLRLLSNSELMRQEQEQGFANVQRFSWEHTAERYWELYCQLLKESVAKEQ